MRMPVRVEPHDFFTVVGPLILLIVALILVELAFKWLPRLKTKIMAVRVVRAKVLERRTLCSDTVHIATANTHIFPESQNTFVTFLVDGQTLELAVTDDVYIKAVEDITGLLTYKGNIVIDFKPLK